MWHELIVILFAMTPTIEAHGAIALGIGLFKFSAGKVFLLSVSGTLIIIPFIIFFLHKIADVLMERVYLANRFLTWLFSYTRKRHAHHFAFNDAEIADSPRARFFKGFALFAFVAFPGPFTGVWGGALAAFVFGIRFWDSVIALALGAVVVAALDTLIIGGFVHFLS